MKKIQSSRNILKEIEYKQDEWKTPNIQNKFLEHTF